MRPHRNSIIPIESKDRLTTSLHAGAEDRNKAIWVRKSCFPALPSSSTLVPVRRDVIRSTALVLHISRHRAVPEREPWQYPSISRSRNSSRPPCAALAPTLFDLTIRAKIDRCSATTSTRGSPGRRTSTTRAFSSAIEGSCAAGISAFFEKRSPCDRQLQLFVSSSTAPDPLFRSCYGFFVVWASFS